MKYDIEFLDSANGDLWQINEYLSDYGEDSLKNFRESLETFIKNISNMPFMFPKYAGKPKYRKAALAYGYIAFYRINERKKEIVIYRILHGKRNIGELI
jgi:plasmid stabilization system protein ParE